MSSAPASPGQVGVPAGGVGGAVPHLRIDHDAAARRDVAVVEHRVDEELERDRHLAPIARQQSEAGGEASAGAGAPDGDVGRVGAELRGGAGEPLQAGVAVLERRGVGMLGRQAVLDGSHHDAQLVGDGRAEVVVHGDAAHHEAATVDPEQGGRGPRDRGGAVEAHDDVGSPLGSRRHPILDRETLGNGRRGDAGGQLGRPSSGRRDVDGEAGEEIVGHRAVHGEVLGVEAADQVHGGLLGSDGRARYDRPAARRQHGTVMCLPRSCGIRHSRPVGLVAPWCSLDRRRRHHGQSGSVRRVRRR